MMKALLFYAAFICITASSSALADTKLKTPDSAAAQPAVRQKAVDYGLADVTLDKRQTFDVVNQGKKLGTLSQGKGWQRDVHAVCFVSWSADTQRVDFFMPTIGSGDWETADCANVTAVGILSRPDDEEIKIAVFYRIAVRDRTTNDYLVLGLRHDKIYFDKITTERFQNSYIKTISAMRKAYQNQ